ncbi:MAG: tyrosine-type recombinase/integrase, partial [Acidimicrobiia bacterium]
GSAAYLVRYRTPGGQQRSTQFGRRREADHFANAVEVDRALGTLIDPRLGRLTVDEWWQRWWPTVTNLRPSTRVRDEGYYRLHIQPVFGATALNKLDRTALRQWVANLVDPNGEGLAPATVQKAVQILNKCVRAALDDRLIAFNPVERLPLPKIEREEMRFLTHAELAHLVDTIDERFRAFALLGGYGGLRLGEMLGLRWSRVDLLRRRVQVSEILIDLQGHVSFGPPKTKASLRTVSLPRFVCEELSRLAPAGGADPSQLVFRSPEGFAVRPTAMRQRVWNPAVQAAGLAPLRMHDLRHTAVSLWIAEGANPKQVAVRAGHTSVSVVLDRYGHLYPEQDEELVQALESRALAAR